MAETRQEIEARLEAASQSMSRRIAAVEGEVGLPAVVRLSDAVTNGKVKKVGLAIGLGLVVGIVAGGLSRSRRERPVRESPGSEASGPIAYLVGYAAREAGTALAKELVKRFVARKKTNGTAK